MLKVWIYNNSWNLIITSVGIVTAFVLLNARVETVSAGVQSIKTKLDRYPSEQYFELKFQNQAERNSQLEKKIDDLNIDVKKISERVR